MDLDFYQPDFTMDSVEFFGEPKVKKGFRVASMRLPKVSRWPRFRSTLLSFITFTGTLYEWKLGALHVRIVVIQRRVQFCFQHVMVSVKQILYKAYL